MQVIAPSNSSPAVRRVAFISLGCPKNLIDSEQMLGTLRSSGFELVSDGGESDAIIINTCGFLEASKQESLDVIGEAVQRKERGELKRVIVAGCLVQRHRAKLLEWAPGIDAMIGVFDRDHIIDAVAGPQLADDPAGAEPLPRYWVAGNALQAARERGMQTAGLTVNGRDGQGIGYFESDANRFRLTPRHWAYLRISEGCNQACAFCTIPSIRGKMRSKPRDRIITEARALMHDGAFEINLIGQDTTSYGYDIERDGNAQEGGGLIGLLTALNDVAREFTSRWIRLMYVYPTYFTDAMIDCIAELPNIVKYIDIPLQHVTDHMLTSMRRNISAQQQIELLYKLRERIPALAIRTTFITGFPGETQADHDALLEFIEDFQFDMLGVFQYSREPGTPAGRMDLDASLHVPDELKAEREREIMQLQQSIAFENAQYVAQQQSQFDVLIERSIEHEAINDQTAGGGANGGHWYEGRCYHQAPQVDSVTFINSRQPLAPGELVRCTVVDADGYDLVAQPTADLDRAVSLHLLGT
ncbi:MAG: 30S ribosomal protein S12 methylthiotransferase RimO [Phycisphaerales bacterium]